MSDIAIRLEFKGKKEFYFSLDETHLTPEVPYWAKFSQVPCPGNHLHGPEINYCNLSCQLQPIVEYFKDIRSIDRGLLCVYEGNDRELRIQADAQSIFFNLVSLLISNTSCSVFIKNQHLKRHYQLSADPQDVFYTYFSIFLVNSYLDEPSQSVNLDKLKDRLKLQIDVLRSLILRLNIAAHDDGADASRNGLVIFEGLLQLMEIKFDEYLEELKKETSP